MPYTLKLVQLNANTGGLGRANTGWGFPTNTNFHTLLMSYWVCGPVATAPGATGVAGVWPAFSSAPFFNFAPSGSGSILFTNQATGSLHSFYQGNFSLPPPDGMLMHVMMSVDTHAQVVQVYINDAPIVITSSAWTGTPPYDFNVANTINIWSWDVSGVFFSLQYPALADAWISNTPAFVDLSVVANRRKFINADLTPVDLGNTGTVPFGYQPAMYMSVRPGGVPTDILTNLGVGGGAWLPDQAPPTFQAPGICSLPPPPTPPGGGGGGGGGSGTLKLAMDNVIVTATEPLLEKNLISLRWSDDRGHSWGSPVTQDIGEAGEYRTSLQWQRLAYARDRCFEISWSVPMRTALQGCWVDVTPAQS